MLTVSGQESRLLEIVLRCLSGPLNRLTLYYLCFNPLDHYRTPSAIWSAIVRPYLALFRIRAQASS